MTKKLYLMLAALLAVGLIAVGCGDDDEEAKDDSPAATQTDDTGGSGAGEDEAEDSDGNDEAKPSDANVKQAVESCKKSVDAAAQLSADVKKDLQEICEEAAAGDEKAVRDASKEVCEKIVEDAVPAGPARDQALKSCDQATTTP